MRVKVRVPATSANLGPGFDCLALALDLWNEVAICLEGTGYQVDNHGEGIAHLPTDGRSLIIRSILNLYKWAGKSAPEGIRVVSSNSIPVGSGLGSSATAILAGFLGANRLLDDPFSNSQVLAMANKVEGHPDNLAAALYGGLTSVAAVKDGLITRCYDHPPLKVVLVLPDHLLPTRAARAVLPAQVPLKDAVFNLSRTVFVLEALRTGDLSLLAQVLDDRLHQTQRFQLIPGAESAARAGRDAGAAAVALSGAGPGMIAFAAANHTGISDAMRQAFQNAGLRSRALILDTTPLGAQVSLIEEQR